jgi:predicted kinase
MKPTLYITVGAPGSGKTHFAKYFCKDNNIFHLNSDRLRSEIFAKPKRTPQERQTIFNVMNYISEELLKRGTSVCYDANNNRKVHRLAKCEVAKKSGANYLVLWLKTPLDTAVKRASSRATHADKYFHPISKDAVLKLKAEIEEPGPEENYVVIDGTLSYPEQLKQLNQKS